MIDVYLVAAGDGRGSFDLIDATTNAVLITATGEAQAWIAAANQRWNVVSFTAAPFRVPLSPSAQLYLQTAERDTSSS